MTGYEVEIKESSKELTKREKVMMKDTSNAISLDGATQEGDLLLSPDFYVILSVHNEKSSNKDYFNYLICDKDGNKYTTGSESFFTTFKGIFEEMEGEDYQIKVYRLPSKNYTGKEFITCSLV